MTQRFESFPILGRPLINLFRKWHMLPIALLASLLSLSTFDVFAQQPSTQETSSQQPSGISETDPSTIPVDKPPPKKEVPKSSSLSAAGLSSGAGGGLPGVDGRVPDMAKVEANGAGSYSISIAVPPGTAGIQPNLALVYNSQGPNGLFGMGWSLKGLPTIHRCRKEYEPDGKKAESATIPTIGTASTVRD